MNIFKALKGHTVVELNNVLGYRSGHMVAQSAFDPTGYDKDYLDNGVLLNLTDTNKLTLANPAADGEEKVRTYLHFSDEHMTFLDSASLDMFTVYLKNDNGDVIEAYPRAIALNDGDTFTVSATAFDATGTKYEDMEADEYYEVTYARGVMKVGSTPGTGKVEATPFAQKAEMPDGKPGIKVFWRGI